MKQALRRVFTRAALACGIGRFHDPITGQVAGRLLLAEAVDLGRATVGRGTYGGPKLHFGCGTTGRVRIGAFCSIAPQVEILAGGLEHRTDWISTFPFRIRLDLKGAYQDGLPAPSSDDTVIGNDVWIGYQALIFAGVTIGHGAVIGARAVVTRDVRPYAIVAGNPAREVRRRFSDAEVDNLLELRWWDWPLERIKASTDELSSGDVNGLLEMDTRPGNRVPDPEIQR